MSRGCNYTLRDTSLMFYVFFLRELCFKLRERSYTRYDVYGNYDCAVSAQEFYMHGLMRIGKR